MKKYLFLTLLIIWMIFIFYNSNQISETSMGYTHLITDKLSELFNNSIIFYNDITITIIRKSAHFIEYFVLGILAYKSYILFKNKKIIIVVVFCVIYAISDEVHQIFIEGRSFQIYDIAIDSIGSLVAITIFKAKQLIKVDFKH